MTWKLMTISLALLLLTACGPDPVRQAKAHAIYSEADTQAAATATAVAIQERSAGVAIAATATAIADEEAVRAATRDDRIARQENLIWWSTVGGVITLLAIAISLSVASVGGAMAFTRRAGLQARLVRLDRATRTWPVMLDIKTGLLVDLETGERARLGEVSQLDHRRLIISGQVRTTGLLAQAATEIAKSAKSPQPGDMLPAIGQSVPLLQEEER